MGHFDSDDDDPAQDGAEDGPVARGERGPEHQFVGGLLIGAAAIALVWILVALVGGGSDSGRNGVTSEHLTGPLAGTAATQVRPSRLSRCTSAAMALDAPLRAAGPAMDQWEVHIGAMNKLVVGAITLKQATQFWDQTRVGARHRISGFDQAMRTMRRQGVDCPAPGLLARAASPALRACSRQVTADLRALEAAQRAIATWDMHVRDMERLRTGKLSAAAAGRMWLSMWHRGQHELDAYRDAARNARRSADCVRPAPVGETSSTQMGQMGGMG